MVTAHRLRSSADIRRTVAARRAAGGAHVVVHARMRDSGGPARVAVVAGRRVGNAVARNRAKRRMRPLLQHIHLPDGMDLVVTAKAGADVIAGAELSEDLTNSVARAVRRATTAATR